MLHDLLVTLPIWLTVVVGCFLLLLDTVPGTEGASKRYLGAISAGGAAASLFAVWLLWGRATGSLDTPMFQLMMTMGTFELAACSVILVITLFVSLMAAEHAEEQGFGHGEFYALIHFGAFGMMVMVTATHLATLFVGLEIMSIAVYVLAAVKRSSPLSAEAGLKYFVLGAFASGILLFGSAYLYGETGQLSYSGIAAALASKTEPTGYLGLALALLGVAFGFKIALVPFHMWTPDVYAGSPPPVAAFMATGVKTAAVIGMARLFAQAMPAEVTGSFQKDFLDGMSLFAILTILAGNAIALHQTSLKRMLGYSSIAHAGYLVIGVMAAHRGGGDLGPVLFYLFTYALANLAVFAVITSLVRSASVADEDVTVDHVAGLSRRNPIAALVLAVGLLSLAGVPPTAGFFGKLQLFGAALATDGEGQTRFLWLVCVAMLGSVISVYYYLRVIVAAYMREPEPGQLPAPGRGLALTMALTALATVWVGFFPGQTIAMSAGIIDKPSIATQAPPAPTVAGQPSPEASPNDG